MTRVFRSIDEIRDALGDEIGPSTPLTVTQERINAFAEATGDHQWIHVDRARAADGPYGATIAHGYLTLSLVPHFRSQLFSINFGSGRINYGTNKVRFPSPVPVDTDLIGKVSIVGLEERPIGHMVTLRQVVSIVGADRPACVAETIMVIVD